MSDEHDGDEDLVVPFRDKLDEFKVFEQGAREKRRSWESPNVCDHKASMVVDRALRTVECEKCKAVIDPFEAIFIVARNYGEIEWKLQWIKQAREKERAKRQRDEQRRQGRRANG